MVLTLDRVVRVVAEVVAEVEVVAGVVTLASELTILVAPSVVPVVEAEVPVATGRNHPTSVSRVGSDVWDGADLLPVVVPVELPRESFRRLLRRVASLRVRLRVLTCHLIHEQEETQCIQMQLTNTSYALLHR